MTQSHFHFEEGECKVSFKPTWSDHSIQRAFSVHWSFVLRLLVLVIWSFSQLLVIGDDLFQLWQSSCRCAYGGHWWRTVGRGDGGQEMTKTVKLKRFYCHGQISALGTNSSKLVEIRMMTLKNHQSTAGPVPTCYTPPLNREVAVLSTYTHHPHFMPIHPPHVYQTNLKSFYLPKNSNHWSMGHPS